MTTTLVTDIACWSPALWPAARARCSLVLETA